MGNYRFRLSYMIPNAWFYKLKDMSKKKTTTTTTNHHKKPPSGSYYSSKAPPENHHFCHPRNSIYQSTPKVSQFHNSPKFPHFHDPPRKSSQRSKPNRKTIYKPSPSQLSQVSPPSTESTQSSLTSCACRLSSSISDITIDANNTKKITFSREIEVQLQLPPIITKPAKPTSRNRQTSLSGEKVNEINQIPARKSVSGVKLRSNSPKVTVSKRFVQKSAQRNYNLSESFAVVKSSFDPEKNFMQSMMEMITENDMRSSKDLEELLACYLSLNSDEYHDVIVKAFEQIWFSLSRITGEP